MCNAHVPDRSTKKAEEAKDDSGLGTWNVVCVHFDDLSVAKSLRIFDNSISLHMTCNTSLNLTIIKVSSKSFKHMPLKAKVSNNRGPETALASTD